MLYLNMYRSKEKSKPREAWYLKFEDIDIESDSKRRGKLQGIVNHLNRRGIDSCVAQSTNSDILVFAPEEDIRHLPVKNKFHFKKGDEIPDILVEKAWQNKVRTHLLSKGFLKTGQKYIKKEDLRSSEEYKESYTIQAVVKDGFPSVYLDSGKRVILPLTGEKIKEAEKEEDASVRVRVLPNWSSGILLGRSGFKAKDRSYILGETRQPTTKYWRIKNQIDFVDPDEEMLKIQLSSSSTFEYPESCVFLEYPLGMRQKSRLTKPPWKRVKESNGFLGEHLQGVEFLGESLDFEGPLNVENLGYKTYDYPGQDHTKLELGNGTTGTVKEIKGKLKEVGPYSGKTNGKFVVLFPENENTVRKGIGYITQQYENFGFGRLEPYKDDGFICTGGSSETDYQAKIQELRAEDIPDDLLVFLVLPKTDSNIYYPSRRELFEDYYGEPLSPQGIKISTLEKIVQEDPGKLPIAVNTASQSYIKLGKIGTATWVLDEPADKAIGNARDGTSCYAYYDVSRRPSKKASTSAYSAMTDSYGRYIATGSMPVTGESLTPSTFHEVLVDLLNKVTYFSRKHSGGDFEFKRLVFAKDGVIYDKEAEMMIDVIQRGVPEEGKEPLEEVLKKNRMYPDELVIDIIGVNKSPNKRIIHGKNGWYNNVREGTAISQDNDTGLLVSCPTGKHATAQPIEIKLHHHFCIGGETPRPSISGIMEEYYRLTFLDWSSLYKQGKFALPQKLTQNLGENLSAIGKVPGDIILI